MKSIVKTRKTLKVIWPRYSNANTMCRILDKLEEDSIMYWYPYWDSKKDEIGIRFTTKGGVIEALPGCVVTIADGHAVRMRKNLNDENAPTTTHGKQEETVARIYDPGSLEDLIALSRSGQSVLIDGERILVGEDMVDVSGAWIVEDLKTESVRAEHGAVSLEEIARDYGGELV